MTLEERFIEAQSQRVAGFGLLAAVAGRRLSLFPFRIAHAFVSLAYVAPNVLMNGIAFDSVLCVSFAFPANPAGVL